MFNDKYGLTQAVLDGRKTMTRRMINVNIDSTLIDSTSRVHYIDDLIKVASRYQVGEIVAVAQSYKTLANGGYIDFITVSVSRFKKEYCGAGYTNKMFTKADLMPHHIRITNIHVERLQDISDEDCLREGISYDAKNDAYFVCGIKSIAQTPKVMFETLIDKVSSKGIWERNPYVFV